MLHALKATWSGNIPNIETRANNDGKLSETGVSGGILLRKLISQVAVIGLLSAISLSNPALATVESPDPSAAEITWATKWDADMNQDYSRVWYTTLFGGGQYQNSHPWIASGKNAGALQKVCKNFDSNCTSAANAFVTGVGLFDFCSTTGVAPCLESVSFETPALGLAEAELVKSVDVSPTPSQITELLDDYEFKKRVVSVQSTWGWKSKPSANIPGSAKGPMIFSFRDRPHRAGKSLYALSASYAFSGVPSETNSNLRYSDFQIAIRPIVEIECDGNHPTTAVVVNLDEGPQVEGTGGACIQPNAFATAETAGWPAGFAAKFQIKVSVRLPSALGGWFQGRVSDADVLVTKIDSKTNRVVFSGMPVDVPVTAKQVPVEEKASEAVIEATCKGCTKDLRKWQDKGGRGPVGRIWSAEDGVKPLSAWSKLLGNKARGQVSLWTFSHFNSRKDCMGSKSELQGLVTTNAMVYQPDTPSFSGGTLNYQVGGLHLNSNGELFEGIYNFKMRSTVARCLYGFKGAAIGGSAVVTSANGVPKVATTTVGESDGWLKVSAVGFSFSTPIIKVKLTQEGFQPTKRTLTCVRGGSKPLVKKVSGLYPLCPDGFTRK